MDTDKKLHFEGKLGNLNQNVEKISTETSEKSLSEAPFKYAIFKKSGDEVSIIPVGGA